MISFLFVVVCIFARVVSSVSFVLARALFWSNLAFPSSETLKRFRGKISNFQQGKLYLSRRNKNRFARALKSKRLKREREKEERLSRIALSLFISGGTAWL
jgi:hypothetical protein